MSWRYDREPEQSTLTEVSEGYTELVNQLVGPLTDEEIEGENATEVYKDYLLWNPLVIGGKEFWSVRALRTYNPTSGIGHGLLLNEDLKRGSTRTDVTLYSEIFEPLSFRGLGHTLEGSFDDRGVGDQVATIGFYETIIEQLHEKRLPGDMFVYNPYES